MATPTYAPGYSGKVAFFPSGGAATDINVTGWDYSYKVDSLDTTGSGSGAVEERIAGLLRGNFGFNLNYDLSNYYHSATPGVLAGAKGVIREYVSATKFWSFPVMIVEITGKSIVSGKVEVTVQAGMDSSSGTNITPT